MNPSRQASSKWKWVEGVVDTHDEYMQLTYGEDPAPVALVAPGRPGEFVAQFLVSTRSTQDAGDKRLQAVQKELDYYLVELGESDPWAYAQYHCTTAANVYSEVHWGYFPKGHMERTKKGVAEGGQKTLFGKV